jgi:hypothetical protein
MGHENCAIGVHFEGQYIRALIVDGIPKRAWHEGIELNMRPDIERECQRELERQRRLERGKGE